MEPTHVLGELAESSTKRIDLNSLLSQHHTQVHHTIATAALLHVEKRYW
jgi:hypothetical protein